MTNLIQNSKTNYDIQFQYLPCNNTRKNVSFESVCKQEGMGMKFKYTAPVDLQENGHVEQNFSPFLIEYTPCSMAGNILPV